MKRIVDYDRKRFDFSTLVIHALDVENLSTLSADRSPEAGWSIYKTMEQSTLYKKYWSLTESPDFAALYEYFVRDVVQPLVDDDILFQAYPTPRIVFADQQGEARFHRDRDYGHDQREVNLQVALTPSFATNAMWIESEPGRADYRPAELVPGQMLVFDGANLTHGAVPNETGRSRVSFDFRVIPRRYASPSHRPDPTTVQPARNPHFFIPCR